MVTATTSTAFQTNTAATPAAAPAKNSLIGSDFQTFLLMLTTQMKNQDPLNPIESSDYAVQLATFSGVEQQVKTNQLLESLGSQMGLMGVSQLAGWVGMEAKAAVPVFYDGRPVTLAPTPATGADQAALVVRDAAGREVARDRIAATGASLEWDGQGLPSGHYSFELESFQNGTLLSTAPVDVYSEIVEAQSTASGTVLVLNGGITIETGDVKALRKPG